MTLAVQVLTVALGLVAFVIAKWSPNWYETWRDRGLQERRQNERTRLSRLRQTVVEVLSSAVIAAVLSYVAWSELLDPAGLKPTQLVSLMIGVGAPTLLAFAATQDWWRTGRSFQTKAYVHIACVLLIVTAIVSSALAAEDADIVLVVFCFGTVGGVINNYRRLSRATQHGGMSSNGERLPEQPDVEDHGRLRAAPTAEASQGEDSTHPAAARRSAPQVNDDYYTQKSARNRKHHERLILVELYVSPLIAGALSVIFYTALAANLVSAPFLPSLLNQDYPFCSLGEVFDLVEPSTSKDAFLVVLWAFVAGFSEKLVPNYIEVWARSLSSGTERT